MSMEFDQDPELRALLRESAGDPPEPDWASLQARVSASARMPLARVSRDPLRRRHLLRGLVPLAAAAGLAAAYLTTRERPGHLAPAERALVEQMVEASVPESVDQLITGEAARGALLEVVGGS